MVPFRQVGLLLRDEQQAYPLPEVRGLLERQGIRTVLLEGDAVPPRELDLVMALGGDGTVLHALERFPQCPVLAINFGMVGFLTAGDRKDLEGLVGLLIEGRYLVSERLALDCQTPHGTTRAINEVILRTSNRLSFTDVFVNGTKIRTIRGDGVVVGTPTGSTAFLMSTGAPIVMPDVRCLILDGINEYNLTSRALILPPESRVRLLVNPETREASVRLTVDGRILGELAPGQEVHICQSSQPARLLYFEPNYFFHNLSSKLSW